MGATTKQALCCAEKRGEVGCSQCKQNCNRNELQQDRRQAVQAKWEVQGTKGDYIHVTDHINDT